MIKVPLLEGRPLVLLERSIIMYAVKSKSGKPLIFVNKQSCETFMRAIKRKPKETLMEQKARLNKLIHFSVQSLNSY